MDLKAYLSHKKMTLAAFGVEIGVPNKQTISRYVRGERTPPVETIQRIEEATEGLVTLSDFATQRAVERAKRAPVSVDATRSDQAA